MLPCDGARRQPFGRRKSHWLASTRLGPALAYHTRTRPLCVTVKERDRILQRPANYSSRGTDQLQEPASLTFPGFRGTL